MHQSLHFKNTKLNITQPLHRYQYCSTTGLVPTLYKHWPDNNTVQTSNWSQHCTTTVLITLLYNYCTDQLPVKILNGSKPCTIIALINTLHNHSTDHCTDYTLYHRHTAFITSLHLSKLETKQDMKRKPQVCPSTTSWVSTVIWCQYRVVTSASYLQFHGSYLSEKPTISW